MIISHRHRFIFIKTHKTAGTSIEVFLSQHCGPEDILTPLIPPEPGHLPRNHEGFFNHMPACKVRERLPAHLWDSYFKFCVERNPWDKTLSHYHMWNWRKGGTLSFDDYLATMKLPLNHPLYTDHAGRQIILDRVLRYEKLAQELAEVFARLGIPFAGDLGVRAKAQYRADRRPYQQVYTEAQRRRVERAFAWEIERHGYRF